MIFCRNMKPAFGSLVFLDAFPHSRIVLTGLTAPGPQPLYSAEWRGDSPPRKHKDSKLGPKLQSRPRISCTLERELEPNVSNPADPKGRCQPLHPGFWQLFSACCWLGAARPLLPCPRLPQHTSPPGGHRPRGAGGTEPRRGQGGCPRVSGRGELCPGLGRVLDSWPNSRGPLWPGRLTVCGPTGPRESPRGCVPPHAGPSGPLRPAAPLRSSRT